MRMTVMWMALSVTAEWERPEEATASCVGFLLHKCHLARARVSPKAPLGSFEIRNATGASRCPEKP